MKNRILIVDDEASGREALRAMLEGKGFVVSEAATGEDGLAQMHSFKPDAVLCDLYLANIDGVALLERSRASGLAAKFIMIAGAGRRSVNAAMELGASGVLNRPLEFGQVLSTIEAVLLS